MKIEGQILYEESITKYPLLPDGTPRPAWDDLPQPNRVSWQKATLPPFSPWECSTCFARQHREFHKKALNAVKGAERRSARNSNNLSKGTERPSVPTEEKS